MKKIKTLTVSLAFLFVFVGLLCCVYWAAMHHLYPIKYQTEILKYSSIYSLDPALVAAVVNVESGYNPDAISGKGAVGLMQLLPSTGNWVATKLDNQAAEIKLSDAETNIRFGCFYLRYLLNKFHNIDLAICAYNAGEGNILKWLLDKNCSVDGKTLSKIPFEQTKNYLAKVSNQRSIYTKYSAYSQHTTQTYS